MRGQLEFIEIDEKKISSSAKNREKIITTAKYSLQLQSESLLSRLQYDNELNYAFQQ